MKATIEKKLKEEGFRIDGIYSKLPELIINAVSISRALGFDHWKAQTATSEKIQKIVLEFI
jgi:hypothetical protein